MAMRRVGIGQRGVRAIERLAVDVEQSDAPSLGEKSLGCREPDPSRGSRYECDLLHCFAHLPDTCISVLARHLLAIACFHCFIKDAYTPYKDTVPSPLLFHANLCEYVSRCQRGLGVLARRLVFIKDAPSSEVLRFKIW